MYHGLPSGGCGKIVILGAFFFCGDTNRCQYNKLIKEPAERVTRACRLWLQWDLFFWWERLTLAFWEAKEHPGGSTNH